MKTKAIFLTLLFLILFLSLIHAYHQLTRIQNISRIVVYNVEVYKDQNCTQYLELIDWGNITINSSYNRTAYIRNSGNLPLLLTMNTSDYNPPEVQLVFNLTWNLEEEIIYPLEVKECTFTLTTGPEHYYIYDFTFYINIYGLEVGG